MIRLFDTHNIRKIIELEGMWTFSTLREGERLPQDWPYDLAVPGCWESNPKLCNYRGRGVYRKAFHISRKSPIKLTFKGVSHTAEVLLDGKKIAGHYNAYTAFSALVPEVETGDHELLVYADNSFSEASALHIPNDYYTYGGIVRPVVLEYLPETFIEQVRFRPWQDCGAWKADIAVLVKNIGGTTQTILLKGTLAGQPLAFGKADIPGGSDILIEKTFDFSGISPWSHENPRLYLLDMKLQREGEEKPIDDLIERVGFRTVQLNGQKLLINGKETFLKGFNRHEDYAGYGMSIPLQAMVHDLDLIQNAGANAVRTSHYPNDERFLDLCDQRGIYVWEENHARGLSLEQMKNPSFRRQCEDCNHEMVRDHFSHPSIILWGILNECASESEYGRSCYKEQFEQLRSLDNSRPLTFATCRHFSDICLDLPDIVSVNMYPRWYHDESARDFFDREYQWIQTTGGKDKPFIVSEFGAAALYGCHDMTRPKYSEERQSDILEEVIEDYSKRPEICGLFIWQFCDCRVHEDNNMSLGRPRARNNKGVVDEYRRPKLAYHTVRNCYNKIQRS